MRERFQAFKCHLGIHNLRLVKKYEIMITGGSIVKNLGNIKASHINGTRAMKKDWECCRCGYTSSTVDIPGAPKSIKI